MLKNNNWITILIWILTLQLETINYCQYQNLEFDHYTTNDGLSNGFVYSILQDSKGFIWIGTLNGLNRFDGLSFKVYQYDSKDTNSVSGTITITMIEDTLKNLWVMTSHNFCCYNRKKDNFSQKLINVINTQNDNSYHYDNLYITGCMIDSRGYLWMGSTTGIYRFKVYNNPQIYKHVINAERYVLNEPDMKLVNKSIVYSFVEDNKGVVWVCSFSNNLFFFNEKQKTFIAQPIKHPEMRNFTDQQKFMIKDRDGDFIITIDFNGLVVWNRKENIFKLYKADGTDNGPNDNILVKPIDCDDGTFWFGARDKGGINIFNKKKGKFHYCLHDDFNSYSLNSNKTGIIYRDRASSYWISGNDGVNKYSPGKQKFKRYFCTNKPDGLNFNNILCFAESKNGNIWIGTDGGGLNLLDRNTGKFEHFLNNPLNPNSLSSNAIISLCETSDGMLWMGTFNGGLDVKNGNHFKSYLPDPDNQYAISVIHIWYVFEDSKKNLWAATLNHGLDLFDRKNQRFYNYPSNSEDSSSLIANSLISMFEDSKQNLYITSYEGVSVIDLKKYDFSKYPPKIKFKNLKHNPDNNNSLSSNGVFCVNEDNEKKLWFGTMSTGLDECDPKTGNYTNYSMNDGLPGNAVSSILIDNQNILWLATDKGLAKFNPKTKEIRVFDRLEGLQNTNLHGWALKAKDGEMFFGGPNGFNSFYPDKIKYNTNQPVVVITGLKIFNKPVKINEKINNRVILINDISETKELTLTYKENYFAFDFIALDYTMPVKNQYAYMMAGFNKDWVKCGTKHEASYTNLDPGNYIFIVKASNNDGIWNETGTSLKVIILPPLWKTWWFRVLLILILITSSISYYSYRVIALQRQKRALEQKVSERTRQLKEVNESLNETNTVLEERQQFIEEQAEVIRTNNKNLKDINELLIDKQKVILEQSEQMKEANQQLSLLNATKDKFFSIIAHDLRNPFNAVSGFSEIMLKKINTMPQEKTFKYLNMIYSASKTGSNLLENLLQWSRSQTERITFEPVQLNLFTIAEEVLKLIEGDTEQKNITLKQLIDQNIFVFADENMLKTVFRNIVSNAIKFSYESGTIILKSEIKDQFVEVNISDSGVGISEENIEKLFRIDITHTTKGTSNESGTGLGLILCKEFVEKNGGKIWVESIAGKGSEFKFTLPLSK